MHRSLGLLGLGAVMCLGGSVVGCDKRQAALVCHVSYGGEEQLLEFPVAQSPYTVKPADVAGRFAFKAIYLREPLRARSVSLYVYERTAAEDRLIQEGRYAPPFSLRADDEHGFTGRQLVYSRDQRELEYWCELPR